MKVKENFSEHLGDIFIVNIWSHENISKLIQVHVPKI